VGRSVPAAARVLHSQEAHDVSATHASRRLGTRSELSAMSDAKLKSHAEIVRRVLFSNEDLAERFDSLYLGPEPKHVEDPETGENQMNESEMKTELERLRAENAQLKTKEKGGISLKVSEKGAVSLYGMGRFPVTLYKEQWRRILESAAEIETFIRENEAKLKTKE
jgi:hypothetical protein